MNTLATFISSLACCLAAIVLTPPAVRAEQPTTPPQPPRRTLNLPATPLNYSRLPLPRHFRDVADRFDNTPDDNPITDHGATLGRVLFYDKTLSANHTTSCASCHKQAVAFTDDRKLSVGFDGQPVTRNSMSLINARYYARGRFFWDERAATLEEQVLMPIENEVEKVALTAFLHTLTDHSLATDPKYSDPFVKSPADH